MVTCPVCGTPATSDDVFCSNCGQRLPQAQAPTPSGPTSGDFSTPSSVPPMPGPPPIPPGGGGATPSGGYAPPQSPVIPNYNAPQAQPSPGPVITPEVQPASYETPPQSYGPPPVTTTQTGQPPKKKLSGCVIALIVVAVLALCGIAIVGGIALFPRIFPPDPGPTPASAVVVPPTPASSIDSPASSGAEVPLDVVNASDVVICYLYISPSASDQWGEDWLGDNETIEPGFAKTVYLTVGDVVDMQVEDCDGNVLDTQYEITVPPEGLTYTLNP
ncbi:MAG: hypothetical protein JXC32_00300 [Anaerolineae bacterium]|nr:hypothetical protein [Anaerolineae bacterium]